MSTDDAIPLTSGPPHCDHDDPLEFCPGCCWENWPLLCVLGSVNGSLTHETGHHLSVNNGNGQIQRPIVSYDPMISQQQPRPYLVGAGPDSQHQTTSVQTGQQLAATDATLPSLLPYYAGANQSAMMAGPVDGNFRYDAVSQQSLDYGAFNVQPVVTAQCGPTDYSSAVRYDVPQDLRHGNEPTYNTDPFYAPQVPPAYVLPSTASGAPFEAQRIVGHRVIGNIKQYEVRWHNTYLNEDQLQEHRGVLDAYQSELAQRDLVKDSHCSAPFKTSSGLRRKQPKMRIDDNGSPLQPLHRAP
ncbi:hypothetical protein LTR97_011745 [Elasticomyces elasticus]|uniref:Uncharacterized protein n=1 Tax=Elasticomyces elasticus TaxID=574655 RepID=A0AAN7VL84_9PEZI|nr:hypothetical protein LTR97_011745 [Elasticomyces elasticus]